MKPDKKANKKWTKFRHKVVRALLFFFLGMYTRFKYRIKVEKFKEQNGRQYLILFNHQTAFDQFFVGMAFKGPVYYLASEDLFSNGFVSSVIRYLVAPIPIKKQTTDIRAIKNCIQVAKEGGTIAIAPEGNRTYSGKTEYMSPSIAYMAKKLGLPIALYRIEGGYGVQPRWSDVVRKGKMRSYVSKVIEPEEYKDLSNDELFALIEKELYVNEANSDNTFKHKKRAEYLERAVYVCPFCGLSNFTSRNEIITCNTCKREISYGENTELHGVGFEFPFLYVNDWYEYQKSFVNKLDPAEYTEAPMFTDKAQLSEVIVYERKVLLEKEADIALYGNRIVINEGSEKERVFSFDIAGAVTVLGRNKANIYYDGKIYQLKGNKSFNALKYVNIYNRYVNIRRGDKDVEFLGL